MQVLLFIGITSCNQMNTETKQPINMENSSEPLKAVVRRFNEEIIEKGNTSLSGELFDPEFINHSAPAGSDSGPGGMLHTFNESLRPAFPDLKVIIHSQVAEGDLVTTRKTITGTHSGNLMGIPPTGKKVQIEVIDMIRIRNGRYYEHWGINTFPTVIEQLKSGQ